MSIINFSVYLQDTRDWLQDVIQVLLAQEKVQFPQKMASALVLMCCAHSVSGYGITVAYEVCIALLRMMAIPTDGGGYDFIRSLMKETESVYVPLPCIIINYFYTHCLCNVNLLLVQSTSHRFFDCCDGASY